jgi:hypothetical protein
MTQRVNGRGKQELEDAKVDYTCRQEVLPN